MQSAAHSTCCSMETIMLLRTDGLPGPVMRKRLGNPGGLDAEVCARSRPPTSPRSDGRLGRGCRRRARRRSWHRNRWRTRAHRAGSRPSADTHTPRRDLLDRRSPEIDERHVVAVVGLEVAGVDTQPFRPERMVGRTEHVGDLGIVHDPRGSSRARSRRQARWPPGCVTRSENVLRKPNPPVVPASLEHPRRRSSASTSSADCSFGMPGREHAHGGLARISPLVGKGRLDPCLRVRVAGVVVRRHAVVAAFAGRPSAGRPARRCSGIAWIAEDPVPTTPTRLAVKSTPSWGQRAVWYEPPSKVSQARDVGQSGGGAGIRSPSRRSCAGERRPPR